MEVENPNFEVVHSPPTPVASSVSEEIPPFIASNNPESQQKKNVSRFLPLLLVGIQIILFVGFFIWFTLYSEYGKYGGCGHFCPPKSTSNPEVQSDSSHSNLSIESEDNEYLTPELATRIAPIVNKEKTRSTVLANPGTFSLLFTSSSNVHILVTDPVGRQTGIPQGSNESIENIPHSQYYVEAISDAEDSNSPGTSPEQRVEIFEPGDGDYVVKVFGLKSGTYTVDFFGYDTDQDPTGTQSIAEQISAGDAHTYRVLYSSVPGSEFSVTLVSKEQTSN